MAALLIARSIAGSMARMMSVAQEIAANNLTVPDINVTSQDEIGKTEAALNQMKHSLRTIVHSLADTAARVNGASQQISTETQQMSTNSEETSRQADVVSNAVQQVTRNLETVVTGAGKCPLRSRALLRVPTTPLR
jgi:methyl-accepting chemotaxis protein